MSSCDSRRRRYGAKRDEIQELLESSSIDFHERSTSFRFQMTPEMIKSRHEVTLYDLTNTFFLASPRPGGGTEQIARLNKEWWVD